MKTDQAGKAISRADDCKLLTNYHAHDAEKMWEIPELIELDDLPRLAKYDVNTII